MLAAAARVEAVECAHSLEAEVRELRLIAAHAPPYNRRSKYPERVVWLKLTVEAYPRLSVVRQLAEDGATYLGPFSSRRTAELAAAGVYDAVPLRQCNHKLSVRTPTPACALAELGRCPAPCEHKITPEAYGSIAAAPFRTATSGDPEPIVKALLARIGVLSDGQRYEEAAVLRSRLIALLRATVRMQRLGAVTSVPELVAARRDGIGGWEIAVVRHGRLAAAATSPPRQHPRPTLDMARATAETVRSGPGPVPAATAEETERILAWLEKPDTRLVESSGDWVSPARGAARFSSLLTRAEAAAAGRDSSVRLSVTDRSDDGTSLRL
jgi:DNA polymerase-3 subunit epsilon